MSLLNWPNWAERTPEGARESVSKFSVGFQKTKSELGDEMDRMGVEEWRMDDVTGSGGDPGVVVRWIKDGREHCVVCDLYTQKGDNLRSIYLWVKETRKSGDRPVKTGQDEFAAAQLPPGEGEHTGSGAVVAGSGEPDPYDVLGVDEGASEDDIRMAAKIRMSSAHPDRPDGGDEEEFKKVQRAKEQLLGE